MTELGDRYRRRADAFAALIDGVPSERWSSPSPCQGWAARDVVAHVVDFSAHVLVEQLGMTDPPRFADFDSPAAAFRATRDVLEAFFDDPATTPKLANYIDAALSFDLPQHGWDLAVATGQDATIDADELDGMWATLTNDTRVWEWQRENGWYAPPVPVPDDAPLQDRVLGLLGRDPTWGVRPQG